MDSLTANVGAYSLPVLKSDWVAEYNADVFQDCQGRLVNAFYLLCIHGLDHR